MANAINVNAVVAKYIELRDRKAQIKAEAEQKTNALTESMVKLEMWIKTQADSLGVTQFKTPSGTAFFKTDDYASVADWELAREFIVANSLFDLLEKRVSKIAVRSYLDEHGQLPPGVNYGTRLVLGVRKPTTNTEEILNATNDTGGNTAV